MYISGDNSPIFALIYSILDDDCPKSMSLSLLLHTNRTNECKCKDGVWTSQTSEAFQRGELN